MMKPLVSILIPAYNAEPWIADTMRSAVDQTWLRKEIIVVDDGSRDQTLEVAQQFASNNVSVVTQENQGASAARNKAFELCQGDYIQWLDADDLLGPDKIEKQIEASASYSSERTLFSCPWAYFYYRPDRANFVPSSLWSDLFPLDWLIRKMGRNLHMPPATWLVSRKLTQAAGPWDTRLSLDDDGEYFCRVILASDAVRFVPDVKVFYRRSGFGSLSSFDESYKKLESQFLSMQLHIQYIRSLEDSERVREACLNYLQTRFPRFYPEHVAFVDQLRQLATNLGGRLEPPPLSWKYAWMQTLFGWAVVKRIRHRYNRWKWSIVRWWEKALSCFQDKELLIV
jgi:glycosyltransferase involved in cell wall biosynthesis